MVGCYGASIATNSKFNVVNWFEKIEKSFQTKGDRQRMDGIHDQNRTKVIFFSRYLLEFSDISFKMFTKPGT